MNTRLWKITDKDLPEVWWPVRDLYLNPPKPLSMHEIFTKKGLKCLCPKCHIRKKR